MKPVAELQEGDEVVYEHGVAKALQHTPRKGEKPKPKRYSLRKVQKRTPKRIHVYGTEYTIEGVPVDKNYGSGRLLPVTDENLALVRACEEEESRREHRNRLIEENDAKKKHERLLEVAHMIRCASSDGEGALILDDVRWELGNM